MDTLLTFIFVEINTLNRGASHMFSEVVTTTCHFYKSYIHTQNVLCPFKESI